jgi:hypothetical protein
MPYSLFTAPTTVWVNGETFAVELDIVDIDLFRTFGTFMALWNYILFQGHVDINCLINIPRNAFNYPGRGRSLAMFAAFALPWVGRIPDFISH